MSGDFTSKRALDLEPGDCVHRVGVVERVWRDERSDTVHYECRGASWTHHLLAVSEAPVPVSWEQRYAPLPAGSVFKESE